MLYVYILCHSLYEQTSFISLMSLSDTEEWVSVTDAGLETSRRSCEVGRRTELWNDC